MDNGRLEEGNEGEREIRDLGPGRRAMDGKMARILLLCMIIDY